MYEKSHKLSGNCRTNKFMLHWESVWSCSTWIGTTVLGQCWSCGLWGKPDIRLGIHCHRVLTQLQLTNISYHIKNSTVT